MEDIAATAGVSPATAYNHFPSKHALIGSVYAPLVQPLLVQAERDAAAGRPVVAALEDQVRALARLTYRYRTLTAAFWSAVQEYTIRVAGPADPGDEVDPRTLAPVPAPIGLLVEHGQRTGELRAYPSATEMSTMVANMLLIRSVNHAGGDPESATDLLLTVLLGTLCPARLVATPRDQPVDPEARHHSNGIMGALGE